MNKPCFREDLTNPLQSHASGSILFRLCHLPLGIRRGKKIVFEPLPPLTPQKSSFYGNKTDTTTVMAQKRHVFFWAEAVQRAPRYICDLQAVDCGEIEQFPYNRPCFYVSTN